MKKLWLVIFFLIIADVYFVISSYAQCTRTAPAARSCPIAAGTAIVADGVTNNNVHGSGAVFYYNGVGGSAKISMTNDGILDVCGSLTVTASSTFNLSSGGTIQVESGGSLTINTNVTLNNTGQIVNRGTLKINGDVQVTNVNATIWNLPGAQSLTIGAGHNLTLQSGSYFINSVPYSVVTIPTLNLSGGFMCLGDESFVTTQVFTSSISNSVLYSGTVFPACLFVTSSAQIGGRSIANNSKINVSLATGFTYTSGTAVNWGSATVLTNSSGCGVVLPLRITDLTSVEKDGRIMIKWNTAGSSSAGEVFNVEKSNDGSNFTSIAVVNATENVTEYMINDDKISAPVQFYRIKHTLQNGNYTYSTVLKVSTAFTKKLLLFPNPIAQNTTLTIIINSQKAGSVQLSLADLTGKIIIRKSTALMQGTNKKNLDLFNVVPGTYFLKVQSDAEAAEYKKILVLSL